MRKADIIRLMLKDKTYRWRYTYVTAYTYGNHFVPHLIAEHIKKDNIKQTRNSALPRLNVETYDGSGQTVHPDLVKRDEEFFMVCTPYPYGVDTYENPSVYRGTSVFSLKECTHNPIAFQEIRAAGCHASDPCILDYQDRLYVFFRDTVKVDNQITEKLYFCESADGSQWSQKKLMAQSNTRSYISPAVIIEGGTPYLYYVDLTCPSGGKIIKAALEKDFHLSEESDIPVKNTPSGLIVWHIAICDDKHYGKIKGENGLIGLFTLRDIDTGTQYVNYWVHFDEAEQCWVVDEELKIPAEFRGEIGTLYKSAIIPQTGDVMLGFRDRNLRWYFAVVGGDRDRRSGVTRDLIDSYRVFSRVFGSDMSWETFAYKHRENPHGVEPCCLQKDAEGKTIGTNCFMGAEAVCGGRIFRLIQSCDTAVVPEARGQGVFVDLISRAMKIFREKQSADLLIGFPNRNSFHGFMKLGWKHVLTLQTYVSLVRPFDVAAAKAGIRKTYAPAPSADILMKSLRGTLVKAVHECCPFGEADFNTINNDGTVKIRRSREYYDWKIDKNRKNFQYITLYRGDVLYAYCIFTVRPNGHVMVADYFINQSVGLYDQLLGELCESLYQVGNAVIFPLVPEGSGLEAALKKQRFICGNHRLFGFSTARMVTYPLNETGAAYLEKAQDWLITYVDLDTVIS